MDGSPIPTKQTCPSRRVRAAAMLIISSAVQVGADCVPAAGSVVRVIRDFSSIVRSQPVNCSRSRLIASHAR